MSAHFQSLINSVTVFFLHIITGRYDILASGTSSHILSPGTVPHQALTHLLPSKPAESVVNSLWTVRAAACGGVVMTGYDADWLTGRQFPVLSETSWTIQSSSTCEGNVTDSRLRLTTMNFTSSQLTAPSQLVGSNLSSSAASCESASENWFHHSDPDTRLCRRSGPGAPGS